VHYKSFAQAELARRVRMPASTLSEFLKGKDIKIDHELYRRIVDIVAPWEYDIQVNAGKVRERFMKSRFPIDEIRKIGMEIAK
jgi:predicted transcriptional regulator